MSYTHPGLVRFAVRLRRRGVDWDRHAARPQQRGHLGLQRAPQQRLHAQPRHSSIARDR